MGFFGPIGVGAVFYLSVCRESLSNITVDGEVRADAQRLSEVLDVIVWFLVICSIVCALKSIPPQYLTYQIGYTRTCDTFRKAGYHLPRTISDAFSNSSTQNPAVTPVDLLQQSHSTATPLSHSESVQRRRTVHDGSIAT